MLRHNYILRALCLIVFALLALPLMGRSSPNVRAIISSIADTERDGDNDDGGDHDDDDGDDDDGDHDDDDGDDDDGDHDDDDGDDDDGDDDDGDHDDDDDDDDDGDDCEEDGNNDCDNNEDGNDDENCPCITTICEGDGAANGGSDCPCSNLSPTGGCLNAAGFGGVLTGTGNASVSNDTLVLTATFPPVTGFFLQGNLEQSGANFGNGLLCLGTGFIRVAKVDFGHVGTATFPEPGDPSISEQLSIPAGAVRLYQVWYRDNGGPCGAGFNTTNGIRVLWGS